MQSCCCCLVAFGPNSAKSMSVHMGILGTGSSHCQFTWVSLAPVQVKVGIRGLCEKRPNKTTKTAPSTNQLEVSFETSHSGVLWSLSLLLFAGASPQSTTVFVNGVVSQNNALSCPYFVSRSAVAAGTCPRSATHLWVREPFLARTVHPDFDPL